MKRILLFVLAIGLLGICSSNSNIAFYAPDCDVCLTADWVYYPSDPYGWQACYSQAEGFCGWTSECGPGTTNGCIEYNCHYEITGCDGPPPLD